MPSRSVSKRVSTKRASARFNMDSETIHNKDYRKVRYTTSTMQLVVMSLRPGQVIPLERHAKATQFIKVERGFVVVTIVQLTRKKSKTSKQFIVRAGRAFVIHPNTWHMVHVPKSATKAAKLYTLYSPPEHPANLVQHGPPRSAVLHRSRVSAE